jgi:acetyl-CoA C-acetyltransferase
MADTDIYVLSGKRTALGSFLGSLSGLSASKLGAEAIKSAVATSGVKPQDIDQVFMGNVLGAGMGQAPARQAAIFAGLPNSTPCTTVNKVCGSGMRSIAFAMQSIAGGESQVAIAGGMENMSQVPHYLLNSRTGYRMGHQQVVDGMIHDGLWDVYNNYHMGNAAELCVREKKFTREEQDAYAIESFKRAQKAAAEGLFKSEITAITIKGKKGDTLVDADEGPGKAQFDKIPGLKPVFDKNGTVTAANASTINDGAAALVLASGEYVKKSGLKPIARLCGFASHAQQPEWFTTAPVGATEKLFKALEWKASSVDLFEINEAFAVVAMVAMRELGLDHGRVNVHGGAISLGHPIGVSGARIVVTLIHALKARGGKRGVASICIGGGEGMALGVELV